MYYICFILSLIVFGLFWYQTKVLIYIDPDNVGIYNEQKERYSNIWITPVNIEYILNCYNNIITYQTKINIILIYVNYVNDIAGLIMDFLPQLGEIPFDVIDTITMNQNDCVQLKVSTNSNNSAINEGNNIKSVDHTTPLIPSH